MNTNQDLGTRATQINNKWPILSEKDGQVWDRKMEMDFTYTSIDKFIRISLGENAHFSNAMYNGDYTLSLEEAQIRKYEFVADQLGIERGCRVLDLGCGWGGWLRHIQQTIGARGIGVNLSDGQVQACREQGLNVFLKDNRYIKPEDFGVFDAVTAFGSFEYVSSVKDYLNGQQDEVYDDYFRHVSNLLDKGGRFYMQSMTFEKNMIPYEDIHIEAPRDSTRYLLALLFNHTQNSWVPYGHQHIIRMAEPYFKNIYYSDGRLDYVQTNKEWTKRFYRFELKKYMWLASLLPKLLVDNELRHQLAVLRVRPSQVCFEREVLGHARLVFEKR
ncbi:class I SAM-dependent methyltransferase [Fulvivirga sp. 29W222]|uniref:Class I SAM-dependent methyltransferase n=1 Tax=Fulvivirga marina TaxID=2494733 RepID=A0A937G1J1_9BACT|nr:class I SAM-dependent methyltransferase [Fulvivirga marina]MBL6448476.1 class I SAM-dependent methyltransferase [Fulvivirga marina]